MNLTRARQVLIDASVRDFSNCIETEDDFRDHAVRAGFRGFNNYTDRQLISNALKCGLHEQDDEVNEAVETLQAEPQCTNAQDARRQIIEVLVSYEIECAHNDGAYLREVFRNGCNGYVYYLDQQLIDEVYSLGLEEKCQAALTLLEQR